MTPLPIRALIHMVSAFAVENGLCLGQSLCSEKSNEITAIPQLLELLIIKGCSVTIDAMGCHTEIAQQIIAKEADYILAVKDNQKELHTQVQKCLTLPSPQ
ncbi:ISAs1 family transposase [Aquimarina sp. RZ0]|uniref:ISAs1 family transposase n=1 Tax=Aquimarina sp. RZ0 TaxID=2607730 RepID=UPI0011F33F70|nr:ISAs1 family transposase [Aquimarina sp. RZ0]KAA1245542.1 ISAs1 family transposase [Aquimarina sp. RZ0]